MSIYKNKLVIPINFVILGGFILLVLTCSVVFFKSIPTNESGSQDGGAIYVLAGGFVTALVVALIQYLLSWFEFTELARLKSLKIKDILLTRDDASYYGKMIGDSKNTIKVLGVTALRFLEDFASEESPKEEKKTLINALKRGVNVQILIASENNFTEDADKSKFNIARQKLVALKNVHPNNFDYRYYSHQPTHSIFLADNQCIVGPQFPQMQSKDTPAIHTDTSSVIAKPYLKYFEDEWNAAGG